MNTFMAEYEKQLRQCLIDCPDDYAWSEDNIPIVIGRMRSAVSIKNYDKDTHAFKRTCKALGIKNTYKAIAQFIASHP